MNSNMKVDLVDDDDMSFEKPSTSKMKSCKKYDFQRDSRGHGCANVFGSLCTSKHENWRPMISDDPRFQFDLPYLISDRGQVYSIVEGHTLRPGQDKSGWYGFVYLKKDGRFKKVYIHQLVNHFFNDNDDPEHKVYVNHKDGVKTNNRKENLESCTPKENSEHYAKFLKKKKAEDSQKAEE